MPSSGLLGHQVHTDTHKQNIHVRKIIKHFFTKDARSPRTRGVNDIDPDEEKGSMSPGVFLE